MDNIQKEIDTYIHIMDFMNNNYDRLPPILQIKYLEEVMKFGESIKTYLYYRNCFTRRL